MVIRRLSCRLASEPGTGDVRLRPGDGAEAVVREVPFAWVEQAAVLTHGGARDAAGALSCSRLPGGGTLLCDVRAPDPAPGTASDGAAGVEVEAVYLPAGSTAHERFWPIDTWGSPAWRDGGGGGGGDGEVLPGPAGRFTNELLSEFAREHRPRVAPFLADVRRLFDDPAGRQIILVEDDPGTVAHWIALACASLPDEYGRALTFTTRTADPYRAPQQILGVGPDTALDRDPVALAHLYRVHDGCGGAGSPAAPDAWADLAAQLWFAGGRPQFPPGADAAEAFAAPTLARQLLSRAAPDAAGLEAGTLDALVAAAATDAARAEPGGAEFDRLVGVCRDLAGSCPPAVTEPLALALGRGWLTRALHRGPLAGAGEALDGLPLTDAARQALRGEFGARADDALVRRLTGPVDTWTEPLHLVLALGGDGGRVAGEAAARLATVLLYSGGRQSAEAVALLERLAHPGLDARVLERLTADSSGRAAQALRGFAASPDGRRLTARVEAAPPALRIAEAAARSAELPEAPRGGALFAELAPLLPEGAEAPAALQTLCNLVWADGRPAAHDLADVVRACPPGRFVAAGLGTRLAAWLTHADRLDAELLDYAHEMLRYRHQLTPRQQCNAELFALARALEQGRAGAQSAVEQIDELNRQLLRDGFVWPGPLWDGLLELLARGLARTHPLDLSRPRVPSFLATFDPGLVRHYQTAVLREYRTAQAADELARQPDAIAALYHVWCRDDDNVLTEWRKATSALLEEVLAPVVARMAPWQLDRVADCLRDRFDEEWARHWARWAAP